MKEIEKILNELPFHKDGMETDLSTQTGLICEYLTYELDLDLDDDKVSNALDNLSNNIEFVVLRYAELLINKYKK